MARKKIPRSVLIAGPTASGKSKVAIEIAHRLGGEIINADAIQVYADLKILSARPTDEDLLSAPHRLFGHIDGAIRYSVGAWLGDVAVELERLAELGKPAIIVGGTGLYFQALTQGLSEAPPASEAVQIIARTRLNELGLRAFRKEVLSFDPEMERVSPSDAQRHIRAFEVYQESGVPLSAWNANASTPLLKDATTKLIIEPDRQFLYRTIEARFNAMIEGGAIVEAARLEARGLDAFLPVMKAVGAAELIAHVRGAFSLDMAVGLAKRNSRRFAKRQLTWFRHRAIGWDRFSTPAAATASALKDL